MLRLANRTEGDEEDHGGYRADPRPGVPVASGHHGTRGHESDAQQRRARRSFGAVQIQLSSVLVGKEQTFLFEKATAVAPTHVFSSGSVMASSPS